MKQYFNWYWIYLTVVGLLAVPVILALMAAGIAKLGINTSWLIVLICGSLLFNTLNQTMIPSLNMIGHTKPFIALTVGTIALGLGTASVLAIAWRPAAEVWLAGLLFGQVIFGLIAYRVFFAYVKVSDRSIPLKIDSISRLFRFSWPISIAVGLSWLHMQGYRFLLLKYVGLAELGLFVAGYGVAASLIAAMELVLMTYFQPIFYKRANSNDAKTRGDAWNKFAAAIMPSTILAVAAVALAATDLTAVMLGPNYQSASRYVMLGAFAEGTRVLVGLFGLIAHLRMKTTTLIIPHAVGAVISTCMIWMLVPKFGIDMAAVALTIGGVAVVLLLYLAASRTIPLRIDCLRVGGAIGMALLLAFLAQAAHPLFTVAGKLTHVVGLLFVGVFIVPAAYWMLLGPLAESEYLQSELSE